MKAGTKANGWLGVFGLRQVLTMLVALVWLRPAQAVEVTDLYTGTVPVAEQSETARLDGQVAALQQVLVKLSGSSSVLALPQVQANLGKAAAYVQRYQYQLLPAAVDAPAGSGNTLLLQVSFDGRALEQLLQEAAAPIWGARRPLTAVWLAVADDNGRRLLGNDDEPGLIQDLQFAARARGLPVVLPILDLEETNQISISDVWGRFLQPLQGLSSRYGAEAVLAGRIEKVGDSWQGELSFEQGSLRESVASTAPSRAALLQQLIGRIAEFVAGKYAVVLDPSKDAEVLVKVHNVRRLEDYGQLSQFFSGLQAVRQADIKEVRAGTALFSLRLIADQSALLQATALDPRLQVVPGTEFGVVLEFNWQP
ncbi:MAG: DUF2066 domain-containing protein [Pseudomonadota bacterium]